MDGLLRGYLGAQWGSHFQWQQIHLMGLWGALEPLQILYLVNTKNQVKSEVYYQSDKFV